MTFENEEFPEDQPFPWNVQFSKEEFSWKKSHEDVESTSKRL
jgi:hypothetical protein